jgi:DNA-binding response OmpR family regulator
MTDNAGWRALIVEDEALVAMLLEDMLLEIGYDAVEIAGSITDGMRAAINNTFAIAILDINLNGVSSFPIADILSERGIPFLFSTGYGTAGLDQRYARIPTLQKPFLLAELKAAVQALTE